MALTNPTNKVRAPRQTKAQRDAVYRYVEQRESGRCLASWLDIEHRCEGPIQRHHAGLKMGMAKITDVRHVTLLCRGANVGAWARIYDREVMAHIARVEDARERSRHEAEEDYIGSKGALRITESGD
jgi:hypothetical protein